MPAPVKACGCGREHDAAGWAALRYVGRQELTDTTDAELRNCPCGSTIAIEVPAVAPREAA